MRLTLLSTAEVPVMKRRAEACVGQCAVRSALYTLHCPSAFCQEIFLVVHWLGFLGFPDNRVKQVLKNGSLDSAPLNLDRD